MAKFHYVLFVIIFSYLSQCHTRGLFDYSIPFSMSDAEEFTWASAAAYCDTSFLVNFNCGPPCDNLPGYQYFTSLTVPVNSYESLQYIMIYNINTRRFIIAFEGTIGTTQLVHEIIDATSISYTLHDIPNAQIEKYFGEFYLSLIRKQFISDLQNAISEFSNYQYIFTGHSLGAALTTIAGQDAILSGLLPENSVLMYTYGSPRVGNYPLAKNIDEIFAAYYRVVHYQDIVPHIPPCSANDEKCTLKSTTVQLESIVWQPWHAGVEMWFDDNFTSYATCTSNFGEDPKCSDSVRLALTSISQHKVYFGIRVGGSCIYSISKNSPSLGKNEERESTKNETIVLSSYKKLKVWLESYMNELKLHNEEISTEEEKFENKDEKTISKYSGENDFISYKTIHE